MKDNYNPYPDKNPARKVGSEEFYGYEEWRDKFYSDKEYHVERVQRGKNIRDKEMAKLVAKAAAASIFAIGIAMHGENFLDISSMDLGNVMIDGVAILLNMELCKFTIKQGVMEEIKKLGRINKDIQASLDMLEKDEWKGVKHGI